MKHILPDVLESNLKVVFCGTAAGDRSAQRGAYYAGNGNQFWGIVHEIGLTPRRLRPEEFKVLVEYGIGLTDLAKFSHGSDSKLSRSDFDPVLFNSKVREINPLVVAFNGKKAAKIFFASKNINYGRQREHIDSTAIFVLPSTSGAARGFWDKTYWFGLAQYINERSN